MAAAEANQPRPLAKATAWHDVVLQTLKRNDIRLVPYVPDRVLTTLIRNLHADPFFTTFPTAREEEAVGIVSGAWMGGLRGAVLMQTSGFATLANVLASLAMPYQIPLIMFVSERGTLGEFNYGQSLVCRTMRPVLDSLAMEHHTATRLDELEFIVDRSIKQAITTQAPVALILSPLLTGGKVSRSERRHEHSQTTAPARNTKVMNRFDLTSRLVAKLKNEEAVVGGIGNTNFDLWAAGHRPQNFYMLGSMGLALPDRARRRAGATEAPRLRARRRRLAADATGLPVDDRDAGAEKPLHDRDGQRHLPDHRRATDPGRGGRRYRRHRRRMRPCQQRLGGRRRGFRAAGRSIAVGIRADADRGAHRRQAGNRRHPARSRADPGTLHARPRRAAAVVRRSPNT